MTTRRSALAIATLTAALGLTACSASGSTPSATTPVGSTSPSSTSPSSTPATPSPSVSPTANGTTNGTTKAAGNCVLIDQAAAESILGFPTKPGLSASGAPSTGALKKIDGCTYISATSGALGYTVVKVNAQIAQSMIAGIKGRMAASGGAVTIFDAGLPNSVGFTQRLPLGVDSQITVAAGDLVISVAATRRDANVAKSQAAAKAAAQQLVASA